MTLNKSDNTYDQMFEECFKQLRFPKVLGGVDYPPGSEDHIMEYLRKLPINVETYTIDVPDYWRYFHAAKYKEDFPTYYTSNVIEKSLEHYIAAMLLNLSSDDVYLDVASEHSVAPAIYKALYGLKSYRQDLAYPSGFNGDLIGSDAADMPVPNQFFSKMALHCSFEHFEGNSDIRFIREIERVLKPGGVVCIVPLYLSEVYSIQTDPKVAVREKVEFENDAILYCAEGWGNRHGRFYDPQHLLDRVIRNFGSMHATIYRIMNSHQVDRSCYVRFAMTINKT